MRNMEVRHISSTATAGNDKISAAGDAYADQKYVEAVRDATEGVVLSSRNANDLESAENLRRAVGIIYDVLVSVWSSESLGISTEKDDILKNAKYAYDVIENMRNEERKMGMMAEIQQLEQIIGNLDNTWKEERKLVTELKKKCDRSGQEIDRKKTANFLLKLANLYIKRAPQKRNLLESCALFAAVWVRNEELQDDVEEQLSELDYMILKTARAAAPGKSLFDISRAIYDGSVSRMRAKADAALVDIKAIAAQESGDDLKIESMYVDKIESLMTKLADDYLLVMREIGDTCIKILGQPPCKFAHAAIGGLPRKEITAHSGLESVILLDSDAKKASDFEQMKEYFRWYSILFQVMMIYFGETPLHALGITSLNDFGFLDKSKDWFCDVVATKGLRADKAFTLDGATASSKDAHEEIELIKTTKEMAKLLENDEAWKSGADIGERLSRNCLITGSSGLLKKFQKRIRKIISPDGKDRRQADDRLLRLMRDSLYDTSYENIILSEIADVESFSRMPAKLFSAIGHLLQVEENSSFDILRVLHTRGFLNDDAFRKLKRAFAHVCELNAQSQSQSASGDGEATSSSCVKRYEQDFLLVLQDLQKMAKSIIDSKGKMDVMKNATFKTDDMVAKAGILLHFGLYQEVLNSTISHDPKALPVRQNVLIHLMKGLSHMKLGHHEEANENFNICMAMVLSLPEVDQPETPQCIQFCIGLNILAAGKVVAAKGHFSKAREAFESNSTGSARCEKIHFALLREIARVHYVKGEYEQAFNECQALETRKGYSSLGNHFSATIMHIMADSLKEIGRHRKSIAIYEKVLEVCRDMQIGSRNKSQMPELVPVPVDLLHILTSLADCHFKVNNLRLTEKYCNEAIAVIRRGTNQSSTGTDKPDLANVKLLLSQCHLKENKHSIAASEACEACSIAFENKYPETIRKKITRTAVTIIFRSLLPVRTGEFAGRREYSQEDLRTTLDCAAQVLDMMIDESTLASGEMERDRSILIRVIQRGTFDLGGYNCILEKCKSVFLLGRIDEEHPNFLKQLLSPVLNNAQLRESCKRDSERLIEIAKSCNIRDSISHTGALIIFVGWLFHLDKDEENWDSLVDQLETYLAQESEDIRVAILHCAVKVAMHVIDYYVSKIEDPSILEDVRQRVVSLVDFANKLYAIVQSQASSSVSLVQESAVLINSIGSCWMRLKEYDAALEMFNEALSLQETLEEDEHASFKGATAILENIALCLARLHRLDEASGYLRRTMSLKDLRRKSRAYEDNTLLEVKVNSASCSFTVGNYKEAAALACEAFHSGLAMDSDKKRNESMYSAAQMVLKATLESSVLVQANKSKHPPDIVQGILDSAVTLRDSLKDRREQLGKKFSDLYDSLLYASANCHLALAQYEPAAKCFKKTLSKLRRAGPCTRTEKSLLLQIAKCQMGRGKFKKAERKLKAFLAMEQQATAIEHLHPSMAHNMIARCLMKRYKYKEACLRAYEALAASERRCSPVLYGKVASESAQIFLETLLLFNAVNNDDID